MLHDRRMRDHTGRLTRANIDHLVVAASGVWVVDAKAYTGSLEVRRTGGLLSARTEQLWIGGRNKTSLVEAVRIQADAVRRELAAVDADVPVRAVLAFVGTDMPWFGASSIAEVALVSRRLLAKLVRQEGELQATDREHLASYLAARFPLA